MMTAIYHDGERAVQARAGVLDEAGRVGRSIHRTIPPAARGFLPDRPWAVVGSVGADGRVWASVLSGPPGFMRALDERRVQIDAGPVSGDPLEDNLRSGAPIGLLVADLATRRRMRVNGTAEPRPEGGLDLLVDQVYANCPKYIQTRELDAAAAPGAGPAGDVRRGPALSADQQVWISGADTFFIATAHPERGADASHRGGMPGSVRVVDAGALAFPDYSGNTMFQTLGNIAANPRAGLLFVDFERGRALQLTGRARIDWDSERASGFVGAERVVDFSLDEVIEIADAVPLRGHLLEYSPFNPR